MIQSSLKRLESSQHRALNHDIPRVIRCLDPSSRESPYWEEACDHSSREFGKRWLVFDQETGQVREPDGTEEVDSQVGAVPTTFPGGTRVQVRILLPVLL